MMYGWYDGNWGIGAWIVMTVVMVIFLAGLIILVIMLARDPRTGQASRPPQPAHHNVEQLLSERFARGEIDEEEFNARRTALRRP